MKTKHPRLSLQGLQVLRFFLDRPKEEAAGADITRGTGVNSGTLYPLLLRLEKAEWLNGSWEKIDPSEAGRPRRKLYRLTHMGLGLARSAMRTLGA